MILVKFDLFVACWGPGTRLKSFLDAIRFDSTVYEPVATLKTSNRLIFYVFRPPFRPADSSIPTFLLQNDFLTKEVTPLDPSHRIRIENLHKMTCLPAPHHFSWIRSWQKRYICSKPFYLNFVMIFQPPRCSSNFLKHTNMRCRGRCDSNLAYGFSSLDCPGLGLSNGAGFF